MRALRVGGGFTSLYVNPRKLLLRDKGDVSLLCLSYEYLWKSKMLQSLTFWVIICYILIPLISSLTDWITSEASSLKLHLFTHYNEPKIKHLNGSTNRYGRKLTTY